MIIAEGWGLWEVWVVLAFLLMLALLIWLVIVVFADIIRSRDLSGWGKAGWTIVVILFPWLGLLGYLAVRGEGISDRAMEKAIEHNLPGSRGIGV